MNTKELKQIKEEIKKKPLSSPGMVEVPREVFMEICDSLLEHKQTVKDLEEDIEEMKETAADFVMKKVDEIVEDIIKLIKKDKEESNKKNLEILDQIMKYSTEDLKLMKKISDDALATNNNLRPATVISSGASLCLLGAVLRR